MKRRQAAGPAAGPTSLAGERRAGMVRKRRPGDENAGARAAGGEDVNG